MSEKKEAARPMSLAEAAELKLLDPAKLRFFKAGASLRATVEGECSCLSAALVRIFPLSQPGRYFSLRDGGGKEIGVLTDLKQLDAQSRRLAEEELERRYLAAVVHRILAVKERFGVVEWEVETNRGKIKFTTRDLRENILRPSPGRLVLSDVEGNRFDVPDIKALDSASQALLMPQV